MNTVLKQYWLDHQELLNPYFITYTSFANWYKNSKTRYGFKIKIEIKGLEKIVMQTKKVPIVRETNWKQRYNY